MKVDSNEYKICDIFGISQRSFDANYQNYSFSVWPPLTSNDFWLTQKVHWDQHSYQVWTLSDFNFLRKRIYKPKTRHFLYFRWSYPTSCWLSAGARAKHRLTWPKVSDFVPLGWYAKMPLARALGGQENGSGETHEHFWRYYARIENLKSLQLLGGHVEIFKVFLRWVSKWPRLYSMICDRTVFDDKHVHIND